MKLLNEPKLKPIDKDLVIEELKRRLSATEYQRDVYKENWIEAEKRGFMYFNKLEQFGGL
jgi:hypothetical protein